MAGLVCLMLCIGAVVWSCVVQVREPVQGAGILIRSGGTFIGINSPKAGWIDELAKVGQSVDAGHIVASLTTPEEDARIADFERRMAQVNEQRGAVEQRFAARLAAETTI